MSAANRLAYECVRRRRLLGYRADGALEGVPRRSHRAMLGVRRDIRSSAFSSGGLPSDDPVRLRFTWDASNPTALLVFPNAISRGESLQLLGDSTGGVRLP